MALHMTHQALGTGLMCALQLSSVQQGPCQGQPSLFPLQKAEGGQRRPSAVCHDTAQCRFVGRHLARSHRGLQDGCATCCLDCCFILLHFHEALGMLLVQGRIALVPGQGGSKGFGGVRERPTKCRGCGLLRQQLCVRTGRHSVVWKEMEGPGPVMYKTDSCGGGWQLAAVENCCHYEMLASYKSSSVDCQFANARVLLLLQQGRLLSHKESSTALYQQHSSRSWCVSQGRFGASRWSPLLLDITFVIHAGEALKAAAATVPQPGLHATSRGPG